MMRCLQIHSSVYKKIRNSCAVMNNSERIARILLLLVNDTLNLIEWNLIDNSNYCNIPKNE
uniref:Uncharacterized protein n=1 Tax=Wuchereria bancrofti TaxID=6293 RepID=A0A1I8EDK8_WUCBA